MIDPSAFRLCGPERAGLRRKMRRASQAGVRVQLGRGTLPDSAFAEVAAAWRRAHGGERGFSMGRFSPALLRCQQVICALQGDRLVGFATFHTAPSGWTLDMMRQGQGAADGVMHLLIAAAIEAAAEAGVGRVSLAAVPDIALGRAGPLLRPLILRLGAGPGLEQFKSAFAPRWEPRFLCAPGPVRLGLAGLALARAIHHPAPVLSDPVLSDPVLSDPVLSDPGAAAPTGAGEYGIASRAASWQWLMKHRST